MAKCTDLKSLNTFNDHRVKGSLHQTVQQDPPCVLCEKYSLLAHNCLAFRFQKLHNEVGTWVFIGGEDCWLTSS